MRVIAIRPEPGLSATLKAGRALGLQIEGIPLFRIEPVDWLLPRPDSFDALLIGSANAMRHAGASLDELTGKPVYAVGEKTAAAARVAGFAVAKVGTGGLQRLLDDLDDKPLRFLRLAGEAHVPLEVGAKGEIITRIVYCSVALPMPLELADGLDGGAITMLHSGEAARHFAQECQRLGVDKSKVCVAALAPRIAELAGPGWAEVACPPEIGEAALLALVLDMCH